MDSRYFSKKIVEWYEINKRDLPWRETKDPYKIWLSEIILQQTRVVQGLPYYMRFTEEFPTVELLAKAPEQKVLRLWQGLGYYSRARNLHTCAKEIMAYYNGVFPSSFVDLKKLPGIGDYTAAAIASFAFNEKVAVVDGNVNRVLSRIYGISTPINSTAGKKQFFELANTLIPVIDPDLFNQAMMEFGALFCTPKNPSCELCVFKSACVAHKTNQQTRLPVKNRLKKIKKRYFYYFVLQKANSFFMKKREEKDIWNGLYDFYLIEKSKATDPEKIFEEDAFLKKIKFDKKERVVSNLYKHVLSHQNIFSRFIYAKVTSEPKHPDLKLYSVKKISELPKPVLISRFLKDYDLL